MAALLAPGMALLRRVGVAGKFGLLAIVLLVPLMVGGVLGFGSTSRSIAVVRSEQDGLRYVVALAQLHTQIGTLRAATSQGRAAGSEVLTGVQDVDELDRSLGARFKVSTRWNELKAELAGLDRVGPDAAARRASVQRADAMSDRLITAVASASGLITDSELDANYAVSVIVERIPRLLDSLADANQLAATSPASGAATGPDVELTVTLRQMLALDRQITADLDKAWQVTRSGRLQRQTSHEVAAVRSLVAEATVRLTQPTGSEPVSRADGRSARGLADSDLPIALARLSSRLSTELADLLAARQSRLERDRTRHTALTVLPLLAAGYLFAALFKSTTDDVRRVLRDISAVTDGAIAQHEPLPGGDEFAQMSRAVVDTRDHLTSLLGELRYSSTHDELTALANRSLFMAKLEDALSGSSGSGGPLAVVLLDLDGFKDLNDSFGHNLGDRLLRVVGARIHRVARRQDLVARLGGDEFALLMLGVGDEGEAAQLVTRVQQCLEEPVDLDGRPLRLRVSAGIAVARPGEITPMDLVRNADMALYAARGAGRGSGRIGGGVGADGGGRGRAVTFQTQMHDQTIERTELSVDLAQVVAAGELTTQYQPIVDLTTGETYGLEALVRWQHPQRGWVPPAIFVPLAETTGLIDEIGRQMMAAATRTMATLRDSFPDHHPLVMDVNLSGAQLASETLVGDILSLVDQTGIDPAWLVLEITESALVEDVDLALRRLGQLAATGVRIALDDFGTGFSSLSYLRRMPIHVIKIDKSFVDDLEAPDGRGAALVHSIISMAAALGLQSVAEGVETAAQAAALRRLGCSLAQGHLFSPALTSDQVLARLTAERRLPAQRRSDGTGALRRPATTESVPLGQPGEQQRLGQAGPLELGQVD